MVAPDGITVVRTLLDGAVFGELAVIQRSQRNAICRVAIPRVYLMGIFGVL